MEVTVKAKDGSDKGKIMLPEQFHEQLRPDLVQRAVLALQSHRRKAYGTSPLAGKRASAKLSRQRRSYKGSYGLGISRVPRKIMSRRGRRLNWVGAFAPGMRGGRRAHPPKAEKIWWQDINKKERRKSLRSAIAASVMKDIVAQRGHKIPPSFPFILDASIEEIQKTKMILDFLRVAGFDEELARSKIKKVRAGKGKARDRKYKKRKGILFVVGKDCGLLHAARNIPGTDVCVVGDLNTELLAPGGALGRVTLWTASAVEKMEKERLFL
ncbi:50S ribosomal protein L4 [Candidatus Woesearchaeota archaeon]|nr:50S ribosomal protein L4 [Candidatus Woesearchaeota archaeon]